MLNYIFILFNMFTEMRIVLLGSLNILKYNNLLQVHFLNLH